jgi:RNA polymerase sigma-70 factor (ECF subfamily)
VVDPAEWAVMRSADPQEFARIVERYQDALSRFLSRFTRCRATLEELAQSTFVEAFRGRHLYRGEAPLIHWLRVIATRVGYAHWRNAARRSTVSLDEIMEPTVAAGSGPAEELRELLDRLPPADRLVLMLHYVEGYRMEEVAAMCGWSRSATKMRALRAKSALRALWERRR